MHTHRKGARHRKSESHPSNQSFYKLKVSVKNDGIHNNEIANMSNKVSVRESELNEYITLVRKMNRNRLISVALFNGKYKMTK